MDSKVISKIINASEEYRRLAAGLSEILKVMDGTEDGEEAKKALERMDSQIRSLRSMAGSLEEIGGVYKRAGRTADPDALRPETAYAHPEFGVSEFGNLVEHEELMPIHME